jgi:hypothetical protein
MADPTRPTDDSRPSDPKELISVRDRESLIPVADKPKKHFDVPSFLISIVLGFLAMELYRKISAHPAAKNILPSVPSWIYYSILGFIFMIFTNVAYRLIRS